MRAQKSVLELHNKVKIPNIGLGTYLLEGNSGKKAMIEALKMGYRLLDTASLYKNENEVGQAIKETGIPRENVFVTSKVWNSDQGYDSTLKAFHTSLSKLQLDYLDLYLIHWPVKHRWKKSWKALEKLYDDGLCRAIGVSNFYIPHLEELFSSGSIIPMVNQVEFHPFLYIPQLLEYCSLHNIKLEAYAPLTHGYKIMDSRVHNLASKYSKSAAQIMLRWGVQHGIIVIPKASSKQHLQENINIFDFSIIPDDIEILDRLNEDFHSDWDPSTSF